MEVVGSSGETLGSYEYKQEEAYEVCRGQEEPSFEEAEEIQNKSFSERVQRCEEQNHTIYIIDKFLRVIINKKKVNDRIEYWDNKSLNAARAVATCAVIVLVGALFVILKESPLGGIVALAGAAFGIDQAIRTNYAREQMEAWKKNPVKGIAGQRLEALEQGLLYIYQKDLLGEGKPEAFKKILSKNELQGLYHRYFHQFKDRLASAPDDQTKLSLLSIASSYSPLASSIYRYALLPQAKIEQMEGIRERYNNFLRAYNGVDKRIDKEIRRVKENSQKLINMIKEENQKAFKPLEDQFASFKDELINTRTRKLEGHPPTGVDIPDYHKQVERDYTVKLRAATERLEKGKEEVSAPYKERIKQVEKDRKEMLERIYSGRNAQLLPLFPYVQALHQEAYKLYRNEPYNLSNLSCNPEGMFDVYSNQYTQVPRPSAPPMEQNYWPDDAGHYNTGRQTY